MATAGDVIDGKYHLTRLIAEGGMGLVFSASHLVTKEDLCLKLLNHSSSLSDASATRFRLEA
ncbi:MAG: serine/threonine protein kinase, partial [Myxococcota bacterium]